jgi:ATP-binding cassette subfamily B protein
MILCCSVITIVLPYLTKIALDNYILPLGRMIVCTNPVDLNQEIKGELTDEDFFFSGTPGIYFLLAPSANSIDSRQERLLEAQGIITPTKFYLKIIETNEDQINAEKLASSSPGQIFKYPKILAIPEANLPYLSESWRFILREADLQSLKILALFFGILMFVGYFFDLGQRVVLEIGSQKFGYNLREIVLNHLFSLSQGYFDRQEVGRLTSRLTSDINNINNLVKSTAASFFSDLLSLVGVAILMFTLSVKLALIALILTPAVAIVSFYFGNVARAQQRALRGKVSEINQNFSETRAGMTIIHAYGREEYVGEVFEKLNHENYKLGLKQLHYMAIFLPLVDFIAVLVLALILYFGGLMVFQNVLSLGILAAFVGYTNGFFNPIKDLAEKVNTFQAAFASIERLTALLEVQEKTLPQGIPIIPKDRKGKIEFKNVQFRYGENSPLVLDDVSFVISPGETVAMVGETGSGKSSIVNLALRFYDPSFGEILFDDTPLKQLDLKAHRQRVGLVTQDVYLYSGTILDNLKLGREEISDELAILAAHQVGASVFIERLPKGFNELLGSEGRSLSAGERQLLSCARALINAPEIIILDEATAFVDSESELLITQAMQTLFKGRTSLIIAHRLSTIQKADHIYVLNSGKIVETGTHLNLLNQRGVYFELALLQGLANLQKNFNL